MLGSPSWKRRFTTSKPVANDATMRSMISKTIDLKDSLHKGLRAADDDLAHMRESRDHFETAYYEAQKFYLELRNIVQRKSPYLAMPANPYDDVRVNLGKPQPQPSSSGPSRAIKRTREESDHDTRVPSPCPTPRAKKARTSVVDTTIAPLVGSPTVSPVEDTTQTTSPNVVVRSSTFKDLAEMQRAYEGDSDEGFNEHPLTWDIQSIAPPKNPGYYSQFLPAEHQWILTATDEDARWASTKANARKVIAACNQAPHGKKILPGLEHWAALHRDKQIAEHRRRERLTFDLPADLHAMPPAVQAIFKDWHQNPKMILPGVAVKKDANNEETNLLSASDVDMMAMLRALRPKESVYRTAFQEVFNTAFHNLEPLAPTIDWDRVPKSSCMWYCMRTPRRYEWNPNQPPTHVQLLQWVVQTVNLQWEEAVQIADFVERNVSGHWHNPFGRAANLPSANQRKKYRKGRAMRLDAHTGHVKTDAEMSLIHSARRNLAPQPTQAQLGAAPMMERVGTEYQDIAEEVPRGSPPPMPIPSTGNLISRIQSAQPLSSRLGPGLCEAGPSSQIPASGARTPLPRATSPTRPSSPPASPPVEAAEDGDDSLYESLKRNPRSRSRSFSPAYE